MATIEKRKKGDGYVYRVKVRVKGAEMQTATFNSKSLAKVWAQKTEIEIKEGLYLPTMQSKKHTFSELVAKYRERNTQIKKELSAVSSAQLDVWDKMLGTYSLSMITPERISKARAELEAQPTQKGEPKSPATMNRYRAVLSAVFSFGVKDLGWIRENPVARVAKMKEPNGRVRYLSDDERKRLLTAVCQAKNPFLYPAVMIGISTGARKGEIMNLKWQDVDLERGWAMLHKTKNRERRGLPLHNLALAALRKLWKNRQSDIWVFPNKFNSGPFNIRKSWYTALEEAALDDFHFHDLRHTCASYLMMNGASLGEIADVLGHKTLQMVQRYSHIADSHKGGVVKSMNDKIFGATQ